MNRGKDGGPPPIQRANCYHRFDLALSGPQRQECRRSLVPNQRVALQKRNCAASYFCVNSQVHPVHVVKLGEMSTLSRKAQLALESLRTAVSKELEKKRRSGHYYVIWRNGKPECVGDDAPDMPTGGYTLNDAPHRDGE